MCHCKRPVDLHIQVLQKLGARIVENGNEIQATCGKLKGAEVIFPKSSVGATEQGILAAVLAEGKTVFTGCAREPEITWLCQYLTGMGAKIEILENGSICIEGVKKLASRQRDDSPGPYCCRNLSYGSGGHQRRDHSGKSADR